MPIGGHQVLVIHFTADDVARTRFSYSPLHELFSRIRLRRPADPTFECVRALRGVGGEIVLALGEAKGYVPDFITPPPLPRNHPDIRLELSNLAAVDPGVVRSEVDMAFAGDLPGELQRLRRAPREGLADLCRVLDTAWLSFAATAWPVVQGRLEHDIATRSRRASRTGLVGQLTRIASDVEWDSGALAVPKRFVSETFDLGGQGLVLAPTVADYGEAAAVLGDGWTPTLYFRAAPAYVARQRADLAELLGRTRASVLQAISAPATTTGVAAALNEDAGNVSRHLQALSRGGLALGERHGRHVWYSQTETARTLVGGTDPSSAEGDRAAQAS